VIRLGHATPAFTMATYQHLLPGTQAEAASVFAGLIAARDTKEPNTKEPVKYRYPHDTPAPVPERHF
jgi:hypothetical protein